MAAWSGPCLNSLPSFCSAGVEVLVSECTFSFRNAHRSAHTISHNRDKQAIRRCHIQHKQLDSGQLNSRTSTAGCLGLQTRHLLSIMMYSAGHDLESASLIQLCVDSHSCRCWVSEMQNYQSSTYFQQFSGKLGSLCLSKQSSTGNITRSKCQECCRKSKSSQVVLL